MALVSVPSPVTVLIPLVILVTTVFGAGLQQTSPMPYLSISLTLGYLDRLGPWSKTSIIPAIYLVLAASAGTTIAYAGMLQLGDKWSNAAVVPVLFVGIGITVLQVLALSIHLAWQRRFLPPTRQNGAHALLATLVGPAVWVAIFLVLYAVSPIGTYGSIAYSQYQFEPLVQWASFSGISGIEYFVVWAAVIIHRCWSRYANKSPPSPSHDQASRSPSSTCHLARRILFAPTPTFLFVSLVVFIYGSMRFWNATGAFYQKPLTDTMLPTVRASCVVGSTDISDMPLYLNQTHELARTGSQIIIWSETVTTVYSIQERNSLWATAKNISQTYGIILGITYAQALDEEGVTGWTKNMYALFDEQGRILFEYQKANPAWMVESTVKAGPNVIPVVNTTYGRVGGAICFDLDVDYYIAQAGHKEVDLLLQPSWTWGSIGRLEASMQSFRAVENGFTLFRCSSWSPSTAYDPFRQLLGYKENLGTGTFTAELPLRGHVKTMYSVYGNSWGNICCVFAALAVVLVSIPERHLEQMSSRVQEWVCERNAHPRQDASESAPLLSDQVA